MNEDIFGSFGYVCRVVSCVSGGIMLGSNYGWVSGVAGGLLGVGVFLLAEKSYRR